MSLEFWKEVLTFVDVRYLKVFKVLLMNMEDEMIKERKCREKAYKQKALGHAGIKGFRRRLAVKG